jgi:pimeloyl-ACP methyl ester carboxylesterase
MAPEPSDAEAPPSAAGARPSGGAAVDLGEVRLHADAWGEGGGEVPLVLVHGWTGSAADWADVGPRLAAGTGPAGPRRVLAVEHRGHGRSTNLGDQDRYTFDLLVEDLGAFLATLGPGPVDLLGHSMGGVVALRHALAHPASVRSLVLMDTAAAPVGFVVEDDVEALAGVGRRDGMAAAHAVMRSVTRQAEEDARRRRAEAGRPPRPQRPSSPARDARVAWSFAHLDPEALVALGRELNRHPSLVDRLGELAMPVTVVVGEDDRPLRPGADVLVAGIPGAHLAVVAGAGHSPQEDAPDAWLAVLADHLARAAAAAAG